MADNSNPIRAPKPPSDIPARKRTEQKARMVHRKKPEVNPFIAELLGHVKEEAENILQMVEKYMDKQPKKE